MPSSSSDTDLILVSPMHLLMAAIPLFIIAALSFQLQLNLERSMMVGAVRTAIQLTICGVVLKPVFWFGAQPSGWPLVAAYAFLMLLLASWESSRRSRYYFDGIFPCILVSFLINVGWISIFAFGFILRPQPLWAPKYVIPISGMLLGNCINGISLALNSILTGLKENATEIELLLSFGATIYEATAHLLREAVRVGAMPLINNMSVIGIISLPGMMTGQILGGSPVMVSVLVLFPTRLVARFVIICHAKRSQFKFTVLFRLLIRSPQEAAKYQILITYLIATAAFGTLLSETWIARRACCDLAKQRLSTDKLKLRSSVIRRQNMFRELLGSLDHCFGCFISYCLGRDTKEREETDGLVFDEEARLLTRPLDLHSRPASVNGAESQSAAATGNIQFFSMRRGDASAPVLELRQVSRSFQDSIMGETFLFRDLSLLVSAGDVVAVSGPSGTGKSQLLRLIAGLTPMHNEDDVSCLSDILILGKSSKTFTNQTDWRRQVRYVSQYKIAIPGTPRMFVERVASLKAWKQASFQGDIPPSFSDMIQSASEFVNAWGLQASVCMDQEWNHLSGGEAQRVYVAICLASGAKVLLMDESTASLDSVSKKQVEQSVLEAASTKGVSVLWISHDPDQIQRMTATG